MKFAQTIFAVLSLLILSVTIEGQIPNRQRPNIEPVERAERIATVETIQFQSKIVGKTLPYYAILPPSYSAVGARPVRYPVLYLLHGLQGHYSDWLNRTKLLDYAALHRLIIITPEGNNGWYTDSENNITDRYESYIIEELIPDVERRYRTIPTRDGRGVAGLSMGGYGAIKFGLKYPELFRFVASFSGALGAATWTENDFNGGGKDILDSIVRTYGALNSPTRQANDIFHITRNLTAANIPRLPFIYLDCGTEDFLYSYNRDFATLLQTRKIPHEFRELPGGHDWNYWDHQIRDTLSVAQQNLSRPNF